MKADIYLVLFVYFDPYEVTEIRAIVGNKSDAIKWSKKLEKEAFDLKDI